MADVRVIRTEDRLTVDALASAVAAQMKAPPKVQDAPPDRATLIARADAAMAKIDLWGLRGITRLSIEEIEAMALVIALTDGIARLRGVPPVTKTPKGDAV